MRLADAHSDLLMELVHFRDQEQPFANRWLPKLQQGGVQIQVCALFSDRTTSTSAAGLGGCCVARRAVRMV